MIFAKFFVTVFITDTLKFKRFGIIAVSAVFHCKSIKVIQCSGESDAVFFLAHLITLVKNFKCFIPFFGLCAFSIYCCKVVAGKERTDIFPTKNSAFDLIAFFVILLCLSIFFLLIIYTCNIIKGSQCARIILA